MSIVSFRWNETDPARPALSVAVRLTAYDPEEKALPLKHDGDGQWSGEFELADDLRTGYQFCPVRDTASPGWEAIMAAGEPDPRQDIERLGCGTYGNDQLSSILEMPGVTPQPWLRRRGGVPAGAVKHVDTGREWPTAVDVYTPADPGERPMAVILLDGDAWMKLDVTATFDNLIGQGAVPPFVCAIVSSPGGEPRAKALTDPAIYLRYVLDELLPLLANEFGVSTRPEHTVLAGQSLGGLAAIYAGLQAQERIGLVLGQSSSLWWTDGPITAEAVIASVAENPAPATRFWLEAGALESRKLVEGNRRFFQVMASRGYQVKYREYQGGHDFACWRGGLADGLISLLTPGERPASLVGSIEPRPSALEPANPSGLSTA
jgi:enterochelin esterase family protein